MGEVYRSLDNELERDVAIKVLPKSLAHGAERMARFRREAKLLASFNHPNIAAIYGLEDSAGVEALVMELVGGPTLADRTAIQPRSSVAADYVRRDEAGAHRAPLQPLQVDEALPIVRQIAEALEYAHEHGVIHRDLKPTDIRITEEGAVKVLDSGFAKALDPRRVQARVNSFGVSANIPGVEVWTECTTSVRRKGRLSLCGKPCTDASESSLPAAPANSVPAPAPPGPAPLHKRNRSSAPERGLGS